MELLTAVCFAIPLSNFAWTVIKDRGYVEGYAEGAMAKKKPEIWKMRDGREISLASMDDQHLVNSIKMVARNCHKPNYMGVMTQDSSFKKLAKEAAKRKFIISILNNPIQHNGRMEYVDVWTPTPRSKLSPLLIPSEWDSRQD